MERDVEAIWRAGKESYHYACEKIIPSRRKQKKIWISTKSWNLMKKRRLLEEKKDGTKSERLIGKYASEYTKKSNAG